MADQIFTKSRVSRQELMNKKKKERSETWLFVCEGTKTEPNYIKSLIDYANTLTSKSPLLYEIKGVGRNTESLVKCVDDFFDLADRFRTQRKGIPFEKTFVLFDKDSFKLQQFNNAIRMAVDKGYIPIWSNECFELWYILHYIYYKSDNGRGAYFDKLTELLGVDYDKADDVFKLIHDSKKLSLAVKFSKKLNDASCSEKSASKRVPCTQVFRIIEEINQRLRIDLTKP